MVHYDVMIDNEGHYVKMSIEALVNSGMDIVRVRSSRGRFLEVRVETLVEVHRHETVQRRNKQLRNERRERRKDPDYDEHPLPEFKAPLHPKIIHHDELPPTEQLLDEVLAQRRHESSDEETVTISFDPPSETK